MAKCIKGYQPATFENCFCMQASCRHYFEDNCDLWHMTNNKEIKIYPYNLENNKDESMSRCEHYQKGISVFYAGRISTEQLINKIRVLLKGR